MLRCLLAGWDHRAAEVRRSATESFGAAFGAEWSAGPCLLPSWPRAGIPDPETFAPGSINPEVQAISVRICAGLFHRPNECGGKGVALAF